jgi:hypothetical protein
LPDGQTLKSKNDGAYQPSNPVFGQGTTNTISLTAEGSISKLESGRDYNLYIAAQD